MLDIVLGILAKAKPTITSIIDCRTVTHRDLSNCRDSIRAKQLISRGTLLLHQYLDCTQTHGPRDEPGWNDEDGFHP